MKAKLTTYQTFKAKPRDEQINLLGKTKAARRKLEQLGWTETHSIMHADDDLDFGTCFIKDDRKFYLNILTVDYRPHN